MHRRRVQRVGNKSLSVTLPKAWTHAHGIKKGSEVYLVETSDGDVRIRGTPPVPGASELTVTAKEIPNVAQFLIFCYTRNIDRIRITGNPLAYPTVRSIKHALTYLEGYEILEESEQAVDIKFIFGETTVTLPNLLRRTIYLANMMCAALAAKDRETLAATEIATDRLHHLGNRILLGCMSDAQARETHGIRSQEEIFFHKDIVRRLEMVSDRMLLLGNLPVDTANHVALRAIVAILERAIKGAPVHTLTKELAAVRMASKHRETQIRLQRIHDLAADILESASDIEFNRRYMVQEERR